MSNTGIDLPLQNPETRKKRLLDQLPKLLPMCLYEVLSVEEALFYAQTRGKDTLGIAVMADTQQPMVLRPEFSGANKIMPIERHS